MVKNEQKLSLKQKLYLSHKLQEGLKVLQCNQLQLHDYLVQQLEENPVLEEVEYKKESEDLESSEIVDKEVKSVVDSFDWFSYESSYDDTPFKGDDKPSYEQIAPKKLNFFEHLIEQLKFLEIDDKEKEIALIILSNLDEYGFLKTSLESLFNKYDIDKAKNILERIKYEFDPIGVASSGWKEALLIQASTHEKKEVLTEIIENYLELLIKDNHEELSKILKIDKDELEKTILILKKFNPLPGNAFVGTDTQYIVPDASIIEINNEYIVQINDEGLPKLRINRYYQKQVIEGKKSKELEYVNKKLKAAIFLIKSIYQRQLTLRRVCEEIASKETEFFKGGDVKPLILSDIADELSIHISTVSRTINNKYVVTPRGIYPIKFFFQKIKREETELSKIIKELIVNEDKKQPFTDDMLTAKLKTMGYNVSRRSVARYRDSLNIPNVNVRRKEARNAN